MVQNRALRGIAISILGLLAWGAGDAGAAAFTVTPVRVLLGRGVSSALLTIRNDSTEPIRFQITLQAWNQTPDGEMELSDTNDLVFFPTLVEVKPSEQKNVRIGSSFKAPVTTERSYRIFFEELPPPQVTKPDEKQTGAQVRVLTKMGVPIFIQPANPVIKGEIGGLTQSGRNLEFEVRNVGNSFFTVNGASATGIAKDGSTTFEKKQDGWYVLAGGLRHFRLEIPADKCSTTNHVRIDVISTLTDERGKPTPLQQEMPINSDACSAAPAPASK
jgi:fimbrial chaperone protein